MALFTSLSHAGEVLAHLVRKRLELGDGQVILGPPREEILDTSQHLRITLLWVNEAPSHRNDLSVRNPDGTLTPPPLSLTATFLFTTYGNTVSEELFGAYDLLGNVMRVFHNEPELTLPLPELSERGEGRLGITLVPLSPELVEKLFGPLQLKHRAFALYEVGPLRLKSLREALAASPVVVPGGVRLAGPVVRKKPVLRNVVPPVQAVGGRVRLDGFFPAAPTRVMVGTSRLEGGDIQVLEGSRAVLITLPPSLPEGTHPVTVSVDNVSSEPVLMRVISAGEATFDALPSLTHSKGTNLVLSGRALSGVVEVVAWPEAGVQSPGDVRTLALASPASEDQLTVSSSSLAPLAPRAYRLAARVGEYHFTPHILLEVVP
ncbi:Pvc16 family protein [Cystobacter ferrugineus]|uniref:Pvc16 N-terminal domain-containing protein n=1 Tax=Cystobacter ferrugineus TaxID=83449 RepID=A0A1L9AWY1_9BACT|nr:Pvc16 family protein [Cystobacter ferrugineus]OJH34507.1 hypothetical protein BON30_42615 [Cystobacter ferrugineus]